MAGSTFGTLFRMTTWGETHGKGVGVVVDGCPAGLSLCEEDVQKYLNRRKPGQSKYTTKRKEDDRVEILSGIFEGKTYEELKDRAEYQAWLDSGGTIAFPEGEEQKEFRSRCVRGMLCQVDRLCEENVENAAFVVHGGTIMAVLEQLAEDQKDFYYWQVENGGGYRMLVD